MGLHGRLRGQPILLLYSSPKSHCTLDENSWYVLWESLRRSTGRLRFFRKFNTEFSQRKLERCRNSEHTKTYWNNYKSILRNHFVSRREIGVLQAENYGLERQLFSYQKSIAYAHSRGTYSDDPATPDGRCEDEEDGPYFEEPAYSLGDRSLSTDTEYAWGQAKSTSRYHSAAAVNILPRRPGRLPQIPRRPSRYHDINFKPRSRHLPPSPTITTKNFNKSPIQMMPPLSLSINSKPNDEGTRCNSRNMEESRSHASSIWETLADFVCSLGTFASRAAKSSRRKNYNL
jgi:hypothetical protein